MLEVTRGRRVKLPAWLTIRIVYKGKTQAHGEANLGES